MTLESFRENRRPCHGQVRVLLSDGWATAFVLNVASHGLRIDVGAGRAAEIVEGEEIIVEIFGDRVRGRVAWARSGVFGMRMIVPLGRRLTEKLLSSGSHGGAGHHGFTEMR